MDFRNPATFFLPGTVNGLNGKINQNLWIRTIFNIFIERQLYHAKGFTRQQRCTTQRLNSYHQIQQFSRESEEEDVDGDVKALNQVLCLVRFET
jgi:hypothetical protein